MRPWILLTVCALACPLGTYAQEAEEHEVPTAAQIVMERARAERSGPMPSQSIVRQAMPWLRDNLYDPRGARIVKCERPVPTHDGNWEFDCLVLSRNASESGEFEPRRFLFLFRHGRFVEGSPYERILTITERYMMNTPNSH